MGQKPARKRGAPRLNVTPEFKANVRHRFEHSEERLATMAADLGCCTETVRAIARREGWVRYQPPPRDLSPAARLRVRAEALAGQNEEPLARERTDVGTPEQNADTAPDPTVIVQQMLHEVAGFLGDVRAERQRMKHELQAVSRVIADCSASLQRLQLTAQRAAAAETSARETDPETAQENAYDDMPADLDAFRDDLARQIDALLEDAPDE
jgi:hypothetical protein